MNPFNMSDLCNPSVFPHSVENIEVIETHLSWVLLTGPFVYKIKKPVNFPFVDFSSMEKRKHFCYEELRLNRRYSPDIYLDVVPVRKDKSLHMGNGAGSIMEYALKMTQLPQTARLDLLIGQNSVNAEMFFRLTDMVIDFHKSAAVVDDTLFSSPDLIRKYINNLENTRPALEKELGMGGVVDIILAECNAFLSRNGNLFRRRQKEGCIRECHGDLHTRNIYYTNRPHLTDCIEFNEELRKIDILHDFAFMVMDIEAKGLWSLAGRLTERYTSSLNTPDIGVLMPFYKCWTSSIRAMVSIMNAQVVSSSERARLISESKHHIQLAQCYSGMLG